MDLKVKNNWSPDRYGEILSPHKSEIVMLRGRGCFHSKCNFCDYYLDKSTDLEANFILNKAVLDKVSGKHKELEVICSGSIQELDSKTIDYIKNICQSKNISKLSLECHYKYKNTISKYKEFFSPLEVNFRIGVESFDVNWREVLMNKNMGNVDVDEISKYFDYCNLLVGIKSQTKAQILSDIEIAKANFKRICIGVYEANATAVERDEELVEWFINEITPELKKDSRFQILIEVSDFPLGDGCMSEVDYE